MLANCYVKLTIGDLLKLEPISPVISVDDGTGCIACHRFYDSDHLSGPPSVADLGPHDASAPSCYTWNSATEKPSGNSLGNILNQLRRSELTPNQVEPFSQGQLVLIHGRLQDFRSNRVANINFIKVLTDPNWEIFHMFQQVDLYRRVYDYEEETNT